MPTLTSVSLGSPLGMGGRSPLLVLATRGTLPKHLFEEVELRESQRHHAQECKDIEDPCRVQEHSRSGDVDRAW